MSTDSEESYTSPEISEASNQRKQQWSVVTPLYVLLVLLLGIWIVIITAIFYILQIIHDANNIHYLHNAKVLIDLFCSLTDRCTPVNPM